MFMRQCADILQEETCFSETEYRPFSKVHFGLSKGVEYVGPVWMKINISRQRLV
jgi:hypothetical protein